MIITDTKMGWSGVNKKRLESYGEEALCFMADEDVAAEAKEKGSTRAVASMDKAAKIIWRRRETLYLLLLECPYGAYTPL